VVSRSVQEICCLMGQPVAGNPTQYVMEQCFARAGLDWRFLTLEVAADDLADAIGGMRAMGFRGAALTTTHKLAVVSLVDELSRAARLIGRVNLINRQDNKLVGENTDGKGLLASLSGIAPAEGKRAVVLGAGGAARAVAIELALAGAAKITVVNRTESRGQELVEVLGGECGIEAELVVLAGSYAVPDKIDLVVNATPVGLFNPDARVPIDAASLRAGTIVADLVYNPPRTWLLGEAKERGCTTLDGLTMLSNQAMIGFKMWTGVEADAEVMRESLEEFLGL